LARQKHKKAKHKPKPTRKLKELFTRVRAYQCVTVYNCHAQNIKDQI